MTVQFKGREVEVELDQNADGSRFVGPAYYIDTGVDLTDDEAHQLQDEINDEINAMWG